MGDELKKSFFEGRIQNRIASIHQYLLLFLFR
jgi:hypothetical protein